MAPINLLLLLRLPRSSAETVSELIQKPLPFDRKDLRLSRRYRRPAAEASEVRRVAMAALEEASGLESVGLVRRVGEARREEAEEMVEVEEEEV